MRACYIVREHDGKCMAIVHGVEFAETLVKAYTRKFTGQKFYISYINPKKNVHRKRRSRDTKFY